MIVKAEPADIEALVALINSCYRGKKSTEGWTTEANIIAGDMRIDVAALTEEFSNPTVTFLKFCGADGNILGTVYLETQPNCVYLGMLSVSPDLQNQGIGRRLMMAAEAHAIEQGRHTIEMNVINLRHELIEWYKKLGYNFTGVQRPFPENAFGSPVVNLHFEVMEKRVP
ncbi:MAG: GNAT family N-acetyltransferase [Bacteroidetes bacterium]|nr:MAG: GNAT family N-acetyltransferase [Bacteroidota bacterium]